MRRLINPVEEKARSGGRLSGYGKNCGSLRMAKRGYRGTGERECKNDRKAKTKRWQENGEIGSGVRQTKTHTNKKASDG